MTTTATNAVDAAIQAENIRRAREGRDGNQPTARQPQPYPGGSIFGRRPVGPAAITAGTHVAVPADDKVFEPHRTASAALAGHVTHTQTLLDAVYSDTRLSETGKVERAKQVVAAALAENAGLKALRDAQLASDRRRTSLAEVMGQHAIPPTDGHDLSIVVDYRRKVMSMPETERVEFLRSAIADGDVYAARALATANRALLGISAESHTALLKLVERTLYPDAVDELERIDRADAHLTRAVRAVEEMILATAGMRLTMDGKLRSPLDRE